MAVTPNKNLLVALNYYNLTRSLQSQQTQPTQQTQPNAPTPPQPPPTIQDYYLNFLRRIGSRPQTSLMPRIKNSVEYVAAATLISASIIGAFGTYLSIVQGSLNFGIKAGIATANASCNGISYLADLPKLSNCASSFIESMGVEESALHVNVLSNPVTTCLGATSEVVEYIAIPAAIKNVIQAPSYLKPALTCATLMTLTALSTLAMESLVNNDSPAPLSDHLWNALTSSVAKVALYESIGWINHFVSRRLQAA